MRAALLVALALAACAAPRPPAAPTLVAPPLLRPAERVGPGDFAFQGALMQGGVAIGQAPPGTATVTLDGAAVPLAADGAFLIGFGRDAPPTATVEATRTDGVRLRQPLAIAARTWRVERLPALRPPRAADPAYLEFRARERATVAAARARPSGLRHWRERFMWPVVGRISGAWGSQRLYGGVAREPHAGVDIARAAGTPVLAPAGGMVVLASPPRLSVEGELVLVDHGHGLVSSFLHLSRVDVRAGQSVRQGERLGAVGATGRATGAHLHWGLSWGAVPVDPALLAGPMPGAALAVSRRGAR